MTQFIKCILQKYNLGIKYSKYTYFQYNKIYLRLNVNKILIYIEPQHKGGNPLMLEFHVCPFEILQFSKIINIRPF